MFTPEICCADRPVLSTVAIERFRATYSWCELEPLEEGDELVRWSVAAGLDVEWGSAVQRTALEFHVGVHVLLVEASASWPSQSAIVAVSTGARARSNLIAAVWRRVYGLMFLAASEGQ